MATLGLGVTSLGFAGSPGLVATILGLGVTPGLVTSSLVLLGLTVLYMTGLAASLGLALEGGVTFDGE